MPRLVSHPDEVKIVSRRFGMGAAKIDRYLELGGYEAVKKCLAQGPDWIIDEMKACSLRGRGGAGFSAGMKWSFVPKQSAKPKYILVNGDESEPGTCKDHLIFLHDPHAVIEGTIIAGLAVGAKMGFIYLRGEYRYLLEIMEKAVADAYERGFLGKNIFGSDTEFQIITQTGAGAYEVGEESALMESLEGKRGVPRIKPPFPAVVGLYGGPTVINNAETIATVPHVIAMGAAAYAAVGTPRNGGTRLFGISGHVERPGVYELPMGYNLKKMIYEVAGGIRGGRKLKAVVPGGSSTPVLLARRDRHRHGLRPGGQSRLHARLRRRRRHRRPDLHRRVRAAHHQLLSARELRLVHSLPRRHRLAQEIAHPLPRRLRRAQATSTTFSTSPKTCWAAPSARSATRRPCPPSPSSRSFARSLKIT